MTILEAIKTIAEQIEGYTFEFDELQMMNVKADNAKFPCIYFEEYSEGSINTKFFYKETTKVILSFMKLSNLHDNGMEREKIREQIKQEAVKIFIQKYNAASNTFAPLENWKFRTPAPRFDSNEVSVILEFNAEMLGTC